jgi:hypothetical protein
LNLRPITIARNPEIFHFVSDSYWRWQNETESGFPSGMRTKCLDWWFIETQTNAEIWHHQFEMGKVTLHLFNAISMNSFLILVRKTCLKPWENSLQIFLLCQCHEIALEMTTSKVPQWQQFFSSDQTSPKRTKNLTELLNPGQFSWLFSIMSHRICQLLPATDGTWKPPWD